RLYAGMGVQPQGFVDGGSRSRVAADTGSDVLWTDPEGLPVSGVGNDARLRQVAFRGRGYRSGLMANPYLVRSDPAKGRYMAPEQGFFIYAQIQRPESNGSIHIKSADPLA